MIACSGSNLDRQNTFAKEVKKLSLNGSSTSKNYLKGVNYDAEHCKEILSKVEHGKLSKVV